MTPGARLAAAIELLGQVDALERPADQVVSDYVRTRRFMGSKDRRAVTDLVFLAVRARARLLWWLATAGGATPDVAERAARDGGGARPRLLAALVLGRGESAVEVAALCDGGRYHPAPLGKDERALLETLEGRQLDDPRQPAWVRLEVPSWLLADLQRAFGERSEAELAALRREAPVDLRVNSLLDAGRGEIADALAEEGIEAEATPLSPLGLRLAGRRAVQSSRPYREGRIELQDEGSQLIALLVAASPGMAVCDFCAGAGGKTLALAAAMQDRGRLAALDVDGDRLGRAGPRLDRAGVRNAERRLLAGNDDPWLHDQARRFDRVLVDAPCSGIGAWRRQPDSRWRLSRSALDRRVQEQARILDQAATLVRSGGRLVYATCSLLPQENRERVRDFQAAHPEFTALPVATAWAEGVGGPCPADGDDLTLTPASHGTDGFYVAVLERQGEAA